MKVSVAPGGSSPVYFRILRRWVQIGALAFNGIVLLLMIRVFLVSFAYDALFDYERHFVWKWAPVTFVSAGMSFWLLAKPGGARWRRWIIGLASLAHVAIAIVVWRFVMNNLSFGLPLNALAATLISAAVALSGVYGILLSRCDPG